MNPIAWQTYEFEHNEKTPDWFWIVGIIGVSLAVIAVIFSNLLFAGLILASTFAIITLGNKEPHLLDCEITEKGIRVQKTFYPFIHLESFNVVESPSTKIIIKSSKIFMTLITIPLGTVRPDEVLPILSEKLYHDEHLNEPFAHVLIEHLGF
ncbi:MAG: hypothetical protein WCO12_03060 [bacterium]